MYHGQIMPPTLSETIFVAECAHRFLCNCLQVAINKVAGVIGSFQQLAIDNITFSESCCPGDTNCIVHTNVIRANCQFYRTTIKLGTRDVKVAVGDCHYETSTAMPDA